MHLTLRCWHTLKGWMCHVKLANWKRRWRQNQLRSQRYRLRCNAISPNRWVYSVYTQRRQRLVINAHPRCVNVPAPRSRAWKRHLWTCVMPHSVCVHEGVNALRRYCVRFVRLCRGAISRAGFSILREAILMSREESYRPIIHGTTPITWCPQISVYYI